MYGANINRSTNEDGKLTLFISISALLLNIGRFTQLSGSGKKSFIRVKTEILQNASPM